MRRLPNKCCLAIIAATFFASFPLSAQEPAGQSAAPPEKIEVRVARLIRRLGSDSYRDRAEAGEELEAIGADSRQALETAAASNDPEVRLRAGELLKQLKAADLWTAGHISCRSRGEPASKVLAELADQSGNHLVFGPPYASFHDANVDLDYPSGQYWPVIDDICRQTGNQVRSDFEGVHRGAAIVAGPPGRFPTAYAGPLRGQITEAVRNFSETIKLTDGKADVTHSFELEMRVRWEDRFHLVGYRSQPEVIEAVTDTGARLTPQSAGANRLNVLGNCERQLSARLKLSPPPIAARQLDRLVVRWGLIAVGDEASLAIDDLTVRRPHRQDDLELTIQNIERHDDRLELTLLVARDGAIPDPQEMLFEEYVVELFDATGHGYRMQNQSNVLTDDGAQLRVTFGGDFAEHPPKTLRLTYPRIWDERTMDFVFRHVPLPRATPE